MDEFEQVRLAVGLIEAGVRNAISEAEPIEEKFRVAFTEARSYWMTNNEGIRFKGGIGAVLLSIGTDHIEYDRIVRELEQLRNLSILLSSVAVPQPEMPDDFKPIGIMKIWHEILGDEK